MGTRAGEGFENYPMVEESDATGAVAGVYAELLTGMPFVPSLFKSLAVHPGYLVLAFEQARPVLADPAFRSLAQDLADGVRALSAPPEDAAVRRALAAFEEPLSTMLLTAAGLLAALRGDVDAAPSPGRAPEARPVRPRQAAPSTADAAEPQLYGEICAALRTPIVNSVWRSLAGQGLLAPAWSALGPQAGATRTGAGALLHRALEAATRVPWRVAATPAALDRAGLADARPGMAAILDTYAVTLSRVLVLVASSSAGAAAGS